jgi:hypothetical protein
MASHFVKGRLDLHPDCASDGSDETDAPTSGGMSPMYVLAEFVKGRDGPFRQVRAQPVLTTTAWRAKYRVLLAMRDRFGAQHPEVSAFAFDLADEAAALMKTGTPFAH